MSNFNNMLGSVNLKRIGETAEINIEGVIGIPEWFQFEDEDQAISTKEKMKDQIKQIEELENVNKIVVNIDSPGGSVDHGKAIYTALKNTKAEIFVNYQNDSASIATVVAAAAKKENVSIPDYVTLLVHEAWIPSAGGTKTDLKRYAENLEKLNLNIATIYAGQNNLSIEENLELIGQDNGEGELLTAERALELGFVGKIEKTIKAAAFNPDNYKDFYTSKQLNKLNTIKMGLFNKEKKAPLQIVSINETDFAHRGIKVDGSFEAVGSEDPVNGSFEIDNTTFEVENSKIVSIKEQEKEVINYSEQIEELKALNAEKDNHIKELVDRTESQEERIEALENSILAIRGESSKIKPPKNVVPEEIIENKKTAAELARERQRQRIAESKNVKMNGGIN